MLTQQRLKELLKYHPDTGVFKWKVSRGRCKPGSIAGHQDKVGHHIIKIDGCRYSAGQLAVLYITGSMPEKEVGHINHHSDDNSYKNLWQASRVEIARNRKPSVNNTSGITGVVWHRKRKEYVAQIHDSNGHFTLGSFTNMVDAVEARRAAEKALGYHENHGRIVPI